MDNVCTICAGPLDKAEIIIRSIFSKQMIVRHKCTQCGAIIGPMDMIALSFEDIRAKYRESYTHHGEADSTTLELEAFHALQPEKGKRYLNYGAGAWSHSVSRLRSEGYDVIGYEPFAECKASIISTLPPDARFDGIYSSEVIEHFQQPIDEFLFMKSLLCPGGRMAHRSTGFEWLVQHTEYHLVFYLGQSVEALCKRTGLAVTGTGLLRIFEVNNGNPR